MRTKIVYSEKCLGYGQWHVEGPERVRKTYEILKQSGHEFIEPQPADEDDLIKVHDIDYVWNVKKSLVEDTDTPAYDNIFEFARLSAGGAILAAETLGFSIMRPPGHHAGRSGAALGAYTRGFCYFNNVAVAVKRLSKPTLILDIDGHHGNGTQEIFSGDPKVNYVSLHGQHIYPGTGVASEGNCLNFPLPHDCGEKTYLQTLTEALSNIDIDKFEVVAVSAGFDTHAGDLASLDLTEESYAAIGQVIGALKKPTFFVLEGGYSGENMGRDIDRLIRAVER